MKSVISDEPTSLTVYDQSLDEIFDVLFLFIE